MPRIRAPPIYSLGICRFRAAAQSRLSSREFALRAMLSQFDKRGNSENQDHGSNKMSPGDILAIVIAALTLLVAMIPLFRCSRFHFWVSSLISPFFEVFPPRLALLKPIHIYIINLALLCRKF